MQQWTPQAPMTRPETLGSSDPEQMTWLTSTVHNHHLHPTSMSLKQNIRKAVRAVLIVVFGTTTPTFAQQGPTNASCTAYMNGKAVAGYSCLAGTDQSGRVNFIQWEDGTASTGLGGWVRNSKNCFAASETPSWKICRD